MIGVNSSNTVNGNNGPDVLVRSEGDDKMNGGNRSDQIVGDAEDDTIDGERLRESIFYF